MSDFLNQNVSRKLSLKDIENKLIQERISQEQEIERINKERELARIKWKMNNYLFERLTTIVPGGPIYTSNSSTNGYIEDNYIDDYFF